MKNKSHEEIEELNKLGMTVEINHRRTYAKRIDGGKFFVHNFKTLWESDGQFMYNVKFPKNAEHRNALIADGYKLYNKGGRTFVKIYRRDELLGEGVAKCHEDDQYNNKRGVEIALTRALKPPKEDEIES